MVFRIEAFTCPEFTYVLLMKPSQNKPLPAHIVAAMLWNVGLGIAANMRKQGTAP